MKIDPEFEKLMQKPTTQLKGIITITFFQSFINLLLGFVFIYLSVKETSLTYTGIGAISFLVSLLFLGWMHLERFDILIFNEDVSEYILLKWEETKKRFEGEQK